MNRAMPSGAAPYPILEVDNEIEVVEYLGTKEKFWVRYNDGLHLLKFGRDGTGENWSEKAACEICTLLDLPHAHYEFARHQNRMGVLSPRMNEEGSRLVLGNELIDSASKSSEGARFYKHRGHTVSRVIAALTRFTDDPDASLSTFIGYLMLDAWVGNSDRHNENWGLVVNATKRAIEIAPTFDHASCLGRELSDDKRKVRVATLDPRADVTAYANKARSGLYAEQSDAKPLSPCDAFRLAGSAGRTHMDKWLKRLKEIDDAEIAEIFNRMPGEIISPDATKFATALLKVNKNNLLG